MEQDAVAELNVGICRDDDDDGPRRKLCLCRVAMDGQEAMEGVAS